MSVLLLESGTPDNLLLEDNTNLLLEDGIGVSTGETRVSQAVLETVTTGQAGLRASQVILEAVIARQATARTSQVVLEAVIAKQAQAAVSQVVLEVLVPYQRVTGFPALLLYRVSGQACIGPRWLW